MPRRKKTPPLDPIEPMSGDEYAGALERLGFSNVRFSQLLGMNDRTGRYYIEGRAEVPAGIAGLLRLALSHRITATTLPAMIRKPK